MPVWNQSKLTQNMSVPMFEFVGVPESTPFAGHVQPCWAAHFGKS